MENTKNYNLKKPVETDYYDVEDQNINMDIIDETLGNKVNKVVGKQLSTEDYTPSEKSKLSGIESGATADQTANEILDLLKTVDSSGSGIDADYLDGKHASDFSLSSHMHDEKYLNKLAKAVDSDKLDGKNSTEFSSSNHNHAGVYENVINKKSGFNLDKSDSVNSSSTTILATLLAVKTAYDKAASAYNLAASKLGASSKAIDSSKLNGLTESTLTTGNTVVVRNSNGDLYARLFNMSYTTTNADVDRIVTISGTSGYMRPSTTEEVRNRIDVARVSIGTSAPTINIRSGDIWIDPNA